MEIDQATNDRGGTPLPGITPSYDNAQAADALTRHAPTAPHQNVVNGKTVISYAFLQSEPQPLPNGPSYMPFVTIKDSSAPGGERAVTLEGFSPLNTLQSSLALKAMFAWSDVANISFEQSPGGYYTSDISISNFSGNETFGNESRQPAGVTITEGDSTGIWVNLSPEEMKQYYSVDYGQYQSTLLHEIGHALGLDHPGIYNGRPGSEPITYTDDAEYKEDTQQYTVMSYFGENNTGADYKNLPPYYTNYITGQTSALHRSPAGPMMDDISAIQKLYGANLDTRTGNDIYGFNSTSNQSYHKALTSSDALIFSVWDAKGNDTFDFSGYSADQVIDLREMHFSNVGGLIMNVSIAKNVTIENAIGGSGNDILIGNNADNVLNGGEGSDVFIGSGGYDQIDGGGGGNILTFAMSSVGVHVGSSFVTTNMDEEWWNGEYTSYWNIPQVRGSGKNDLFEFDGWGMWGPSDYRGGGGDDIFKVGPVFNDVEIRVDGGDDEDILDLSGANRWGDNNTLVYDIGIDKIHYSVSGGDLYLTGFEHIDFGLVFSLINGTEDNDIITSGKGNSTVVAGAGNDIIHGGSVQAGAAANVLSGNLGNDIIDAAGAARIYGGSGNDIITGSGVRDFIDTGFKLTKLENGVVVLVESDNDIVDAGAGNDVITGLSGNDSIEGGSGIYDEFLIAKSNSTLEYSLSDGNLLVSCGSDTALLSGVEYIRVSDLNSYAPDLFMKVSDIIAQLVQQAASMTGTALVAALQQDGKSTEDNSTIHASDYNGVAPGGGTRDIDGDGTGGVTYENKTGVTVTVRDYVEPGHVATVTGAGINNKIYNAAEIVGSANPDRFDVAGHQWPALRIDGAGGYDVLTFASADAGVTVDALNGTVTGVGNGLTFAGIDEIHGSTLSDTFYLKDDQIILFGGGGGNTADFSRSTRYGLELSDSKLHNISNLIGTQGSDTFKFLGGSHSFTGGGGYDTVTYDGATTGITIAGTAGTGGAAVGDTYINISEIVGTASSDRFSGMGAFYKGAGGWDEYLGGSGGSFDGGSGTDTVSYANTGPVNLDAYYYGTSNNYGDYLLGVERFVGSNGNDVFADGYGDQYQQGVRSGLTFEGQDGDDSFTLAWGSSALGGVGDDVFTVVGSYNETTANLYGGSGYDLLIIKDGAFSSLDMQAGVYRTYNDRVGDATSIEEVWAPWGTVNGTGNLDVIKITTYGGTYAGSGIANGGGGNDLLSSDVGSMAELHGGAGNDLITSLGYDKLFGDGDDDTIYGGARTNEIWGGSGNDTIYTAPRDNFLTEVRGGSGTNRIAASGDWRYTEVIYDFTKSNTDGDGGGLVSVVDQGGIFRVVTNVGGVQVVDLISGVANIFFPLANQPGWSEAFYLRPGINYSSANQSMMVPSNSFAQNDEMMSSGIDSDFIFTGDTSSISEPVSPTEDSRQIIFDGESFLVFNDGLKPDYSWSEEFQAGYGVAQDSMDFVLQDSIFETSKPHPQDADPWLYGHIQDMPMLPTNDMFL